MQPESLEFRDEPDHGATPVASKDNPQLPRHDLHNHTIYSGHSDADATVLNILCRATSLDLDFIGISEHIMQVEDMAQFRQLELEVRGFSSMGAHALLGVEMDINPEDPEGNWVVPGIQCDYVILSAHGFPQFDLELPESEKYLPPAEQRRHLAEKWLAWYGKAVGRGGFQILGHPLREPIIMGLIDLNEPEFMDNCINLFRPAIDRGIVFELNNSFLAAIIATAQIAPYLELVWRLRSMGMKFARCSDSHGLLKVGASEAIFMAANAAEITPADWLDASTLHRG